MAHLLVVGGTGMLRFVCLYLADQGHAVSVIARRSDGLETLVRKARTLSGSIHPLQVDYQNTESLAHVLDRSIQRCGLITLAVCWIHSTAPRAPFVIAELAGTGPADCRYFDLVGSSSVDPSMLADRRQSWFDRIPHILYRAILLGFIVETGGVRWLTDDEISQGVIEAIEQDKTRSIVGAVQPWCARP